MRSYYHSFFGTLGTKLRIDILTMLKNHPLGVNELAHKVNQERSKVSHALKSLLKCGFVHVAKEGRNRIYSLNTDTILPLLNLIERHIKKYCKLCRCQKEIKDA